MNVWVFKINTRRGWEFDQYFRSRVRGIFEMGDEGWIRSARSLRYLRREVKRGDLFLCYEVDRKQMVGAARAASDGRDAGLGSLIDFCPPRQAVRFQNPLVRRPDLDHILAFTPQRGRGTVQKIDRDEFSRLRRIMLRKNPEQAAALMRLFAGRRSSRPTGSRRLEFSQRNVNDVRRDEHT
jgi:hypothetical protein